MRPKIKFTISNWLSKQRQINGMTQAQLSELLNKPQSFVSKYENNERHLDFLETLEICFALNVDPMGLIELVKKEWKIK